MGWCTWGRSGGNKVRQQSAEGRGFGEGQEPRGLKLSLNYLHIDAVSYSSVRMCSCRFHRKHPHHAFLVWFLFEQRLNGWIEDGDIRGQRKAVLNEQHSEGEHWRLFGMHYISAPRSQVVQKADGPGLKLRKADLWDFDSRCWSFWVAGKVCLRLGVFPVASCEAQDSAAQPLCVWDVCWFPQPPHG